VDRVVTSAAIARLSTHILSTKNLLNIVHTAQCSVLCTKDMHLQDSASSEYHMSKCVQGCGIWTKLNDSVFSSNLASCRQSFIAASSRVDSIEGQNLPSQLTRVINTALHNCTACNTIIITVKLCTMLYLAQFHHHVQKECKLNHHLTCEGQVTYTSQDHQASQGSVLYSFQLHHLVG